MWHGLYNYGLWMAQVSVNGHLEDSKRQFYPPHGTLPTTKAPPGSIVNVSVQHIFMMWYVTSFYTPEFGWVYTGMWRPALAGGTVRCIMPFFGG
jgi:hypothetical protein